MKNRSSKTPLDFGVKFSFAAIRERALVYVSTFSPEIQAKGLPDAELYGFDPEDEDEEFAGEMFGLIDDPVRWNCVSVCAAEFPQPQMVAVGEYGQVRVFGTKDDFESRIVPEDLRFREVRSISGVAYACAVDRKVFRRDGTDQWTPIHGDMPSRPGPDVVLIFESIHGFGPDDLYAVGWHGEIWYYDGQDWHEEESPTHHILNRVYCAPDGFVYACGLAGTLLKGHHGQWTPIAVGAYDIDYWDLEWFGDRLWISSHYGLFTLDGDTLQPVQFDDDAPSTFGHLDARHGILWTVGSDDILQFDGSEWERIA